MSEKRRQAVVPLAGRTERLERWWASLDVERRKHAIRCVQASVSDASFLEGLRAAGIGLADVGWMARGTQDTHIPRAVQQFVAARTTE